MFFVKFINLGLFFLILHIFVLLPFQVCAEELSLGNDQSISSEQSDSKLDNELDNLISMDLEDVMVYVASKRNERIQDAPGIISVITSEDIRRYGARDLNDLLTRVPGLFVYGTGDIPIGNTSIRGVNFSAVDNRVSLMFNGRPIRDGFGGGQNHTIYWSTPLEIIEQIEIIRGPGSVLYGTNAFSGVINIITRNPENDNRPTQATLEYGSFNSSQASGSTNFRKGEFTANFGFKFYTTDGWEFKATDTNGVTDNDEMYKGGYGMMAQLDYKDTSLTVFASKAKWHNIGGGFDFPFDRHMHRREFVDFKQDFELFKDWTLTFNGNYNGFFTDFNDNTSRNYFNDMILEPTIRGKLRDNLQLLTGYSYERVSGKVDLQFPVFTTTRQNYYLQMDYQPWDFVNLIAGFQVNKLRRLDPEVSPRFGGVFHLPHDLGLKVLYGEAYVSPFPVQLGSSFSGFQGNPSLQPETIETFDAQVFYQTNTVFAALTYFQSRLNNPIVSDAAPDPDSLKNGSLIEFKGMEFEAKLQMTNQLEMNGSVSYQENEEGKDPDVGLAPNWMVKTGISYDSLEGYSLGLFNSYIGEPGQGPTSGTVVNPAADSYNWMTLKGSVRLREFLDRRDIPDMDVNLFMNNLLDEDAYFSEFRSTGANTMPFRPGFNVYGSITFRM